MFFLYIYIYIYSKSYQVSRTLLSIMADLRNTVVWMVSILSLISNCSDPLTNPLGTVPYTETSIGITAIFMFHSFYSSLERSKLLSIVIIIIIIKSACVYVCMYVYMCKLLFPWKQIGGTIFGASLFER